MRIAVIDIRLTILKAILGSFIFVHPVRALNCPEPPSQLQQSVATDLSAEIKALKRFLGEGGLGVKVSTAVTNLYEKYPNADQLVMAQMMLSLFCSLLQESKDLNSAEKIRLFSETRDQILRLGSAQPTFDASVAQLIKVLNYHASKILVALDEAVAEPGGNADKAEKTEYITDLKRTRKLFLELHAQHIDALQQRNILLAHELARDIEYLIWMTEHRIVQQTGRRAFDDIAYMVLPGQSGRVPLIRHPLAYAEQYPDAIPWYEDPEKSKDLSSIIEVDRIRRVDSKLKAISIEK